MPKRLPDEEWAQRQKLHKQKVSKARQKIINYIEKYHRSQSRCNICNRKGTVFHLTRESVMVRCAKCKKEWIFKKKFSRAFLPSSLFVKPTKDKINKLKTKKNNIILKVKPLTLKQIAEKNKAKQILEEKILDILKGNIIVKLSTSLK